MTSYEIITLVFSATITISTIFYVVLTNKLAKETRLSREFFLESKISAYLEVGEAAPSYVYLTIKNLGKGIAKNVRFTIEDQFEHPNAVPLSKRNVLTQGMDFMPPNHKISLFLMDNSNYDIGLNFEVTLRIEYSDELGEKTDKYVLKLNEVVGFGKLTPPPTYIGLISHELKQIKEEIKRMSKTT